VNDATNPGQGAPEPQDTHHPRGRYLDPGPEPEWFGSQPQQDGRRPWFDPGALAKPPEPEPEAIVSERIYRTWQPGGWLAPEHEHLRAALDARFQAAIATSARDELIRVQGRRALAAAEFRWPTLEAFPGTLADSLAMPRPVERDLITGMLGVGHNISIEAIYKTGKSVLTGAVIGVLADGGRFLGIADAYPPEGRIGVWNCEMTAHEFDDECLVPYVRDHNRVAVCQLRGHPMPILTSDLARQVAIAWLRYWQVQVWVVDTWTKLCAWNGVDPGDNAGVARLTACVDEIKADAGVSTAIVTAHMPHQARTDRIFERGIGAQAYSGWADALWRYVEDEHGQRFLSIRGRRVHLDERQVIMAPDRSLLAEGGSRAEAGEAADHQEIGYLVISWVRQHPGDSTNKVRAGVKRRASAVSAALEEAEGKGLIVHGPPPGRDEGPDGWWPRPVEGA
jgi:hypothetical protein